MKLLINGMLVLFLGLLWALESVLGKLTLVYNATPYEFPLILNTGTVIAVSLICLFPKYRSCLYEWKIEVLPWVVCVALSLVFVPYCILYLSLRSITPAEASLITSLTPVFSMLLGIVLFRTRIKYISLLALALGIIGVGLIIIPRLEEGVGKGEAMWYTMMLFVPLSYAASGYFLRKCADLKTSYIQMLLVTNLVSAGLFLLLNGGLPSLYGDGQSIIYLSGIAINISAICLMLFVAGRMSPFELSFSNYANLMFSFVLSVLFFSQSFSILLLAAITLIIGSSLIAQEKRKCSNL